MRSKSHINCEIGMFYNPVLSCSLRVTYDYLGELIITVTYYYQYHAWLHSYSLIITYISVENTTHTNPLVLQLLSLTKSRYLNLYN